MGGDISDGTGWYIEKSLWQKNCMSFSFQMRGCKWEWDNVYRNVWFFCKQDTNYETQCTLQLQPLGQNMTHFSRKKNNGNNLLEREFSQILPPFLNLNLTYHICSALSWQWELITKEQTLKTLNLSTFDLICAVLAVFHFGLLSSTASGSLVTELQEAKEDL